MPSTPSGERDARQNEVTSPPQDRYDLWEVAYSQLAVEDENAVESYEVLLEKESAALSSKASVPERAEAIIILKKKQILKRQWKLQWGHRSIKIRSQIDRVVKLIDAFKNVGSTAVNVDPVHAGLPWAGICLLVVVSHVKAINSRLDAN